MPPRTPALFVIALWLGLSSTPTAAATTPELLLQLGHRDRVLAADVVPLPGGGAVAISSAQDGEVKWWDATTGLVLGSVRVDHRRWEEVRLDAKGRSAVVWGGNSGNATRIDLRTGRATDLKMMLRQNLTALCATPDRRRVAVGGRERALALFSFPDYKPLGHAPSWPERRTADACAFSHDGTRLAALVDGQFLLYEVAADGAMTPRDKRSIGLWRHASSLAAHPSKRLWVAADQASKLVIWDEEKAERVLESDIYSRNRRFVMWTPSGDQLVYGGHGDKGRVYIQDAKTGKERAIEDDLGSPGDTARWLSKAGGKLPLTAFIRRDQRSVEIWDLGDKAGPRRLSVFEGRPQIASALAFLPDGRRAALGDTRGQVRIWDLGGVAAAPEAEAWSRKPITALAFSGNGRWKAVGTQSGQVIARRTDGKDERSFSVGGRVQALTFLADSQRLLVQGDFKTRLFNVETGFEDTLPGMKKTRGMVAIHPDGKRWWVYRVGRLERYDATSNGAEKTRLEAAPRGYAKASQLIYSAPRDELIAVFGQTGVVVRLDASTGKVVETIGKPPTQGGPTTGPVRVALTPDGKTMAGVDLDSVLHFWRLGEAKPRAHLLIDEAREWVAWDDAGHFDASAGGGRYVSWRLGHRVLPLERFRARFHTPGLLHDRVFASTSRPADVPVAFEPPPEVRITKPGPGTSPREAQVEVEVEVRDAGGGVAEVSLYHQGRVVARVPKGRVGQGATTRHSFRVLLEPGPNQLVAAAMSDDRIESRSTPLRLSRTEGRTPRLRLLSLAVGIDRYRDSALKLRFARGDAEAVHGALKKAGPSLYKRGVEQRLLVDDQATRAGILEGLQWLASSSRPEDVVIVYLAGHGETVDGDYYFLPQDLKMTGLDSIREAGISQETLMTHIQAIPARKVVIFMDSCKAGGASAAMAARGLAEKKALAVLAQAAGVYMVGASTSHQDALEDARLGHGVFTWALLRGLEGKADLDGDKAVSVRELVTWLEAEVARVSSAHLGREQYPVSYGTGRNFPLTLVPKGS